MSEKILVITRGDSLYFNLLIDNIDSCELPYRLAENDKLYFGIMHPHQTFENALVRKVFTREDQDLDGYINIRIAPEDTLDKLPGTYYYAIKLKRAIDDNVYDVITVVNKTKLFIND